MTTQLNTPQVRFKADPYAINYNNRYTPPMPQEALAPHMDDVFMMQEMQNQRASKKEKNKERWYKTGICAQVGLAVAFAIMAITSILTHRLNSKMAKANDISKAMTNDNNVLKFKSFAKDSLPELSSDSVNPKSRDFIQMIKKRCAMDDKIAKYSGSKSAEQCVLFHGPSGTGKTFSAKLMANELGAEYAEVDFPKIASPYVGQASININNVFSEIAKKAKAEPNKNFLVAFNEIDSMLVPMEKAGTNQSYVLENRTAFLNGLDAIKEFNNIKIVGTTNASPETGNLDLAALSRFGNLFKIELPTKKEIIAALKWHMRDCKAASEHKFFENNTNAINSFAEELVNNKFSQRDVEKLAESAQTRFGISLEGKTNFSSEKFDIKYLKEALQNKEFTTGSLNNKPTSIHLQNQDIKLNAWQKFLLRIGGFGKS